MRKTAEEIERKHPWANPLAAHQAWWIAGFIIGPNDDPIKKALGIEPTPDEERRAIMERARRRELRRQYRAYQAHLNQVCAEV